VPILPEAKSGPGSIIMLTVPLCPADTFSPFWETTEDASKPGVFFLCPQEGQLCQSDRIRFSVPFLGEQEFWPTG